MVAKVSRANRVVQSLENLILVIQLPAMLRVTEEEEVDAASLLIVNVPLEDQPPGSVTAKSVK
jgi:hypothetical protein